MLGVKQVLPTANSAPNLTNAAASVWELTPRPRSMQVLLDGSLTPLPPIQATAGPALPDWGLNISSDSSQTHHGLCSHGWPLGRGSPASGPEQQGSRSPVLCTLSFHLH